MSKTKIQWATDTWNPIPRDPRYLANTDGDILGPMGKILRSMSSRTGHLYVFINRQKKWVHRLVLEAFVGPCPSGCETRHLDGNPLNNKLENLVWDTHKQNSIDRVRHGAMPVPHESVFTKLTPMDIPIIREMAGRGKSSRAIGKQFGTSHTTIQKILRGKRWRGY